MSPNVSSTTPSVFYKLPNDFIRRHGFSSNTNHFIYREINTKPVIQNFVRRRVKEVIMDLYEIAEEQHIKRHNADKKNLSVVQNMFPTELVNPEKYKQEQEQKAWEKKQAERIKKWKETHLAKKFMENNKILFKETDNDLDKTQRGDKLFEKKENIHTEQQSIDRPVVVDNKRILTVKNIPKISENKTRVYKITTTFPNKPVVVYKRVVINKSCCI